MAAALASVPPAPSSERTQRARLVRSVGRYAIYGEIAHGGMATIHLGRLKGAAGFWRTVAIKRLHAHYANDPQFVEMFLDEVRLASRIHHPNVVSTLDVVSNEEELFLVMEYVHGETLARLIRTRDKVPVPPPIAAAIMSGVLRGLHAAHEAKNQRGEPLELVHRDVSPQNVLVGADGIARVLDFGVAKAAGSSHTTQDGVVKGKIGYMSPEQIYGDHLDRRTDVYAAGVLLWELLVGQRLFVGESNQAALAKALTTAVEPPGVRNPSLPAAVDDVVMRALEREAQGRYATALEMATVLEGSIPSATPSEVASWVQKHADDTLAARARLIAEIEALPDETELPLASATESGMRSRALPDATLTVAGRPAASRSKRILLPALGVLTFGAAMAAAFALGSAKPAIGRTSLVTDPASTMPPRHMVAPAVTPALIANTPVAPPEVARSAPPSARTTARTARSSTSRPVPAASCDPPFVVDAQGHKRYKKHCFR